MTQSVHQGWEERADPEHGPDAADVNDLSGVHSASSELILYDAIFREDLLLTMEPDT